MRILVITGGIGSGKSEACRILKKHGYALQYDADSRAKHLYERYPELLRNIEKALDMILTDGDGCFIPSVLAERIFSDKEALDVVERFLFPVFVEDFESYCEGAGDDDVVIFESATVLEKPYFEGFGDKVLLIDAPFEVRLERACSRGTASRESVMARMNAQKLMNELSEGRVDPRIDCVVLNDGSVECLEHRLLNAMKNINI